ncbi:MAG: rhomboid family intramembrane serine protease [Chloroflexi bacterium]|nr:rhomboid family intramembrane serine protease [Chloroflexota bacterium]
MNTPPYSEPVYESEPTPRSVPVQIQPVRPRVTYILLAVTVFVYILQELTRIGIAREPFIALSQLIFGDELLQALLRNGWGEDILVLLGGKITPLIEIGQVWRLFTPALLHASLVHIAFNMYALFVIGPSLESFYGHWRFLALYVLGAFGGNVLSFYLSAGTSVGASTAIFAMVAAQGVFLYQNRQILGPRARAMLSNVIFIIVINLFLGLSPGIDNWGHMGGLITGLAFAWFAGPQLSVNYTGFGYQLTDQRSMTAVWSTGILLALALAVMTAIKVINA